MKTKNKLLITVCCFAMVTVSVINAEEILLAEDLRAQATVLYKDGQADKALIILHQARKEYEKVLATNPDDELVLRGLAMTLFDLGEYRAANEMFKKAGVKVDVKSFDVVEIVNDEVPVLSNMVAVADDQLLSNNVATISVDSEIDTNAVATIVPQDILLEIELAETPSVIRGIELSPNLIYDGRANLIMGNIISFAERAKEMNVNTVFVHAFGKSNAKGAFDGAYFDNSVLPVRAEILKPLVKELADRNIAVYAIMPLLSFAMAETDGNNAMMVMSEGLYKVIPSVSWRQRLSPFNTNAVSLITQIYSDLVSSVPLNGIVFGDDAYLTDLEDLNREALNVYSNKLGINKLVLSELDPVQRNALSVLRSDQLDILCEAIMVAAKKEQPKIEFIRTLYASAINHPPSEEWFSQNYKKALQIYNQVLVLADPELEAARSRGSWVRKLSENVIAEPSGAERTIFRLPNYSNVQRSWISEHQQAKLLRLLSKAGLHNFVLGPDDYIADRPRLKKAKRLF